MKIYLAGPISGKGYNEVVSTYQSKIKMFKEWGYDVFCPMTGKSYLRNEIEFKSHGLDEFPVSTNHAIFERDKWMVSQCDIVFADLSNSGERISIGTIMEIAWASLLGKHTVLVLPESNIHKHAFVLEGADIIFPTREDAYTYFQDLTRGIIE
jgi:nucleoside 2-deoxyribosyltransferase